MSVRSGLADALTEALPTFAVIDHSADTVPAKATAMVYVEKVDHGTTRPLRTYTLTVLVIVPQDDEGALEDALEDVLEAVDSWAYPATWNRYTVSATHAGFFPPSISIVAWKSPSCQPPPTSLTSPSARERR